MSEEWQKKQMNKKHDTETRDNVPSWKTIYFTQIEMNKVVRGLSFLKAIYFIVIKAVYK